MKFSKRQEILLHTIFISRSQAIKKCTQEEDSLYRGGDCIAPFVTSTIEVVRKMLEYNPLARGDAIRSGVREW